MMIINSAIATIGMSFLEGYTEQNDNLHVPALYLSLYFILEKLNPIYIK